MGDHNDRSDEVAAPLIVGYGMATVFAGALFFILKAEKAGIVELRLATLAIFGTAMLMISVLLLYIRHAETRN